MTQKTPRIYDVEKIVHGNKIKSVFTSVPFTTIVNEQGQSRKIADLTLNLKASLGVERIPTYSIKKVDNEFGSNGQTVWSLDNQESRVRFIGMSWVATGNSAGYSVRTANIGDYIEVTFYGTGINMLVYQDNVARTWNYVIDSGGTNSITTPSTPSDILAGRNYSPNIVVPVVSGQSLGWHTVRIINNGPGGNELVLNSLEILNESSQLVTNAGQPFVGGYAAKLDAQTLLDYKPTALTGTKGGRVKVYQTEDGTLAQAVTLVDATAQYLSSTSHINEEIVKKINFREFGRNRADDFSTLTTLANRTFTLDDGITSLVGSNVATNGFTPGGLRINNTGGASYFVTLTFIGTGLDIIVNPDTLSTTPTNTELFIDGGSVGNISTLLFTNDQKLKLCSGLPYGTHTVKILLNSSSAGHFSIQDFIVYQPKESTLPEGAVEIVDYNVLADFAGNTSGNITPSTGVVRKQCIRELIYSGSWSISGIDVNSPSGLEIFTASDGSYIEYTFWGTGIEHNQYMAASARNYTYSIDGSTDLSGFTTNFYSSNIGSMVFTPATGVLSGTPALGTYGNLLSITGLALGKHTLRVTKNTGGDMYSDSFDVITPIHINSKDLKIGSLSLLDMRFDQQIEDSSKKVDLSRAKAWVIFNGVGGEEQVFASYNIASVLRLSAGVYMIYFKREFKDISYVVSGSSDGNNYFGGPDHPSSDALAKLPGHCKIKSFNNLANPEDERHISAIFYGELEDEINLNLEDL